MIIRLGGHLVCPIVISSHTILNPDINRFRTSFRKNRNIFIITGAGNKDEKESYTLKFKKFLIPDYKYSAISISPFTTHTPFSDFS